MLKITIPAGELWDQKKEEIISVKEQTLQLEHSLVSISKWESKWCKAFFMKKQKSYEEIIDYIKCMTLTPNVDPNVYLMLTQENIDDINKYIESPMTATYISDNGQPKGNREVQTAEVIYCNMITLGIPVEFQKWHINRLLTLIKVCDIKNRPPKKMGRKETISKYAALNAARRKQLHSKG